MAFKDEDVYIWQSVRKHKKKYFATATLSLVDLHNVLSRQETTFLPCFN